MSEQEPEQAVPAEEEKKEEPEETPEEEEPEADEGEEGDQPEGEGEEPESWEGGEDPYREIEISGEGLQDPDAKELDPEVDLGGRHG